MLPPTPPPCGHQEVLRDSPVLFCGPSLPPHPLYSPSPVEPVTKVWASALEGEDGLQEQHVALLERGKG